MTALKQAPEWLADAVRSVPCAGCGCAESLYVGVYVRDTQSRAFVYRVCGACRRDLRRVAAIVERRVRLDEAHTVLRVVAGGRS